MKIQKSQLAHPRAGLSQPYRGAFRSSFKDPFHKMRKALDAPTTVGGLTFFALIAGFAIWINSSSRRYYRTENGLRQREAQGIIAKIDTNAPGGTAVVAFVNNIPRRAARLYTWEEVKKLVNWYCRADLLRKELEKSSDQRCKSFVIVLTKAMNSFPPLGQEIPPAFQRSFFQPRFGVERKWIVQDFSTGKAIRARNQEEYLRVLESVAMSLLKTNKKGSE